MAPADVSMMSQTALRKGIATKLWTPVDPARIERFDDPATPYLSWAAPQFIHQFEGDYDHLARLWEWHVIGEGEADA